MMMGMVLGLGTSAPETTKPGAGPGLQCQDGGVWVEDQRVALAEVKGAARILLVRGGKQFKDSDERAVGAVQNFDVAPVPPDTIVIHGESDEVVPLSAVFDWARPQALPITVVPGAGHFFHGQLALLKSLVLGAWHAPTQP